MENELSLEMGKAVDVEFGVGERRIIQMIYEGRIRGMHRFLKKSSMGSEDIIVWGVENLIGDTAVIIPTDAEPVEMYEKWHPRYVEAKEKLEREGLWENA